MKPKKAYLHSLALCSLLFLSLTFPLWTQATPAPSCTPCPVEISGYVYNPAGNPVYGSAIALSNGTYTLNTLTDAAGFYRIAANICILGNYTISVSAVGYTTQSTTAALSCGAPITKTVTLAIPTPTPVASTTPAPTATRACTASCDGMAEGYVYNAAGNPLAGVTVTVGDLSVNRSMTTAADGYYGLVVYWCPVRTHYLTVAAAGEQKQTIKIYPQNCASIRNDFITAPASTVALQGDVNGDRIINIVDALMIAQYVIGIGGATFNPAVADVDCNGRIDIVDALIVAQYYVGLISAMLC